MTGKNRRTDRKNANIASYKHINDKYGDFIMKCSKCENEMVLRKMATKIGAATGLTAGGVTGYLGGTAAGGLCRDATGAAIGMKYFGPAGAITVGSVGAIAGGIGALGGGAAGTYVGSKCGEIVDEKIIAKYVCKTCGHEDRD